MSDQTLPTDYNDRPVPPDGDDRTWFDILVDIHSGPDYPGSGIPDSDYEAEPYDDYDYVPPPTPYPLHQADILITVLYQAPDVSQALDTAQEIARWYNQSDNTPGFSSASSWQRCQEAALAALHLYCFPPLPTHANSHHTGPATVENIIDRTICQLAELETDVSDAVDDIENSRELAIENALAQPTLESLRQALDALKSAMTAARIWRNDSHLLWSNKSECHCTSDWTCWLCWEI